MLQFLDVPCMAAISSSSLAKLSSSTTFTQQHVANMAWAFATLGFRDAPLCDALASAARPTMAEPLENVQALASMPWALSRLPCCPAASELLRATGARGGTAAEALGPLLTECEEEVEFEGEWELLSRLADGNLRLAALGVLGARSLERGSLEATTLMLREELVEGHGRCLVEQVQRALQSEGTVAG
mmetsp:Transcript_20468/g.42443  ORF Transcript_20468/g.42443 Transcript_20468/m.42443 type:complete len:187 (-) Transcript_20468:60-620(-)